jgi:hypothetical protein
VAALPRIAIGTLLAVAIAATGFGLGVYVSKRPAETKIAVTETEKPEPNFNTYDISPPSRANTIITQDVKIQHNDGLFAVLTKDEAADIRTGQKVLLYDRNDNLLEALGVVRAIDLIDEPKNKITILLRLQDTATDANVAVRGRIVTQYNLASARLPHDAFVTGEEGKPYLWQTEENADGTTSVHLREAVVTAAEKDFFVIDNTGPRGDYVLNPDDKLRDGQTINVRRALYSGPLQNDVARVEDLIRTRKLDRQALAARKIAKSGATGAGCGVPKTVESTSNGCSTSQKTVADFLAKVKKLAPSVMPSSKPAQ